MEIQNAGINNFISDIQNKPTINDEKYNYLKTIKFPISKSKIIEMLEIFRKDPSIIIQDFSQGMEIKLIITNDIFKIYVHNIGDYLFIDYIYDNNFKFQQLPLFDKQCCITHDNDNVTVFDNYANVTRNVKQNTWNIMLDVCKQFKVELFAKKMENDAYYVQTKTLGSVKIVTELIPHEKIIDKNNIEIFNCSLHQIIYKPNTNEKVFELCNDYTTKTVKIILYKNNEIIYKSKNHEIEINELNDEILREYHNYGPILLLCDSGNIVNLYKYQDILYDSVLFIEADDSDSEVLDKLNNVCYNNIRMTVNALMNEDKYNIIISNNNFVTISKSLNKDKYILIIDNYGRFNYVIVSSHYNSISSLINNDNIPADNDHEVKEFISITYGIYFHKNNKYNIVIKDERYRISFVLKNFDNNIVASMYCDHNFFKLNYKNKTILLPATCLYSEIEIISDELQLNDDDISFLCVFKQEFLTRTAIMFKKIILRQEPLSLSYDDNVDYHDRGSQSIIYLDDNGNRINNTEKYDRYYTVINDNDVNIIEKMFTNSLWKSIVSHFDKNDSNSNEKDTNLESHDKSMTINKINGFNSEKMIINDSNKVVTISNNNNKSDFHYGWKLASTLNGKPCIVELKIFNNSSVVKADIWNWKFRTNKAYVNHIYPVYYETNNNKFIMAKYDISDTCGICIGDKSDDIIAFVPCGHSVCEKCYLNLVKHNFKNCIVCKSIVADVIKWNNNIKINTEDYKVAKSRISDSKLYYTIGQEVKEENLTFFKSLFTKGTCDVGIHYHDNINDTYKWFCYNIEDKL